MLDVKGSDLECTIVSMRLAIDPADEAIAIHDGQTKISELAQGRGELPRDLDLDLAIDVLEGPFATKRLMRGESITPEQIPVYIDAALYGLKGPSTCKDELS